MIALWEFTIGYLGRKNFSKACSKLRQTGAALPRLGGLAENLLGPWGRDSIVRNPVMLTESQ